MTDPTCQHHDLEKVQTTEIADPERRYLVLCRGCGLCYEEFECGRCGSRSPEPKACRCRKLATGGVIEGEGELITRTGCDISGYCAKHDGRLFVNRDNELIDVTDAVVEVLTRLGRPQH